MKALIYELQLLEPVLVMEAGSGDPNSANSLPYIPGSSLRGALIGRKLNGQPVDAIESDLHRLFLAENMLFLNAYPQTNTGERMLPVPLSWRTAFEYPGQVFDWAFFAPQTKEERWFKWTEKARRNPFCALYESETGAQAEFWEEEQNVQLTIHIARSNRQQVTGEGSTIFRYRALAPGQCLVGAVLGPADKLAEIEQLMPANSLLRIGKSMQAGYGLVRVQKITIQDNWTEYSPSQQSRPELAVTLLSDGIFRHPITGAYTADLGIMFGAKPSWAYVRTRLVGGFNRTWGLPLPQTLAVCAGSVYLFHHNPELEQKLQNQLISGIGERTGEGFGRLAINWQAATRLVETEPARKAHPGVTVLTPDSQRMAEGIVTNILRSKLDEKLIAAINGLSIQSPPQNTQLARLRVAVRRGILRKSAEPVLQHLQSLKKTARDQFESARLAGARLWDWLNEKLAEPHSTVTQELGYARGDQVRLGSVQSNLDALVVEYTLRLIEGVLRKATKEGGSHG